MIVARLAVLEVLLKQHEARAARCRFESHKRCGFFMLAADVPAFFDPSSFSAELAPTDEHNIA
jgi:hypothetical protein